MRQEVSTKHKLCWSPDLGLPSPNHENLMCVVQKPPSLEKPVTAASWTETKVVRLSTPCRPQISGEGHRSVSTGVMASLRFSILRGLPR